MTTINKRTISLCMIVKDEEVFLGRCLDSVKNQVDEIIIVDTGSTDATVNIAKEYGAKVYPYQWNNDFAAARNFSVEQASSDYILVLDADEYLDADANIQSTLSDLKDFYILNFKNYMDNGYVTTHQAIRLFKNKAGFFYKGKIHEHLNIDRIETHLSSVSEFVVHHDGYQKNIFENKNKYQRNLVILEIEVREHPTGYNLFNLGVQYKANLEYDKALNCFAKSYSLSKDQIYLPYLLYLMGDCLLQLNRIKEGINLMKDSTAIFPTYTGYYFILGSLYEQIEYFFAAEKTFKKCLELGEVKNFQSIEGVGTYLAEVKLSEILQKQGKLVEALEHAFFALQHKKSFSLAISQYLKVLMQAGLEKDVVEKNVMSVFNSPTQEELVSLLKVLAVTRSSMLLDIITNNNIQVDISVQTLAYQYANKYTEALDSWKQLHEIGQEELIDYLVLLIATGDFESVKNVISKFEIHKKEKALLETLFVTKGKLKNKFINKKPLSIMDKAFQNLLQMKELRLYMEFLESVKDNKQAVGLFIKNLELAGYSKELLDFNKFSFKEPSIKNVYMDVLGDIYLREANLPKALEVYNYLYNENPNYVHLNKLYNFYQRTNDLEGMRVIEKELITFEESALK